MPPDGGSERLSLLVEGGLPSQRRASCYQSRGNGPESRGAPCGGFIHAQSLGTSRLPSLRLLSEADEPGAALLGMFFWLSRPCFKTRRQILSVCPRTRAYFSSTSYFCHPVLFSLSAYPFALSLCSAVNFFRTKRRILVTGRTTQL